MDENQTDWLPIDAEQTRNFFNSTTGEKLMARINGVIQPEDGGDIATEAFLYNRFKGSLKVIAVIHDCFNADATSAKVVKFRSPITK